MFVRATHCQPRSLRTLLHAAHQQRHFVALVDGSVNIGSNKLKTKPQYSASTVHVRSQSSLVGSLPSVVGLEPSGKTITPKPPSLLIKAVSNTLLNFLTSLSDLSAYGQALFVAPSNQAGIPAGNYMQVPPEVTNYQMFLKADALQTLNHPVYTVDGAGSYFELLAKYMRFVQGEDDSTATNEARDALFDAERAKNSAYEIARHEYIQAQKANPESTETFIEKLNKNKAYHEAWEAERDAQNAYTECLSPDMQDVIRQLDIIKSANDRLVHKVGNNMPCNAISQDFISTAYERMNASTPGESVPGDTKNLYYRPAYSLPDYEHICNVWSEAQSLPLDGPYPISLHPDDLESSTWAALGHPALDEGPVRSLSDAQLEMLSQIKASITFNGRPAVLDVHRGLWDVSPLRSMSLTPDAPPSVRQPFVKTTKLLLAWGLRIDIELPEAMAAPLPGVGMFFMGIPLKSSSENPRCLTCTVGGAFYPVLVAALGRVVGGV